MPYHSLFLRIVSSQIKAGKLPICISTALHFIYPVPHLWRTSTTNYYSRMADVLSPTNHMDQTDDLFEVVVEEKGTSAAFEIPHAWRHETITESSLEVEILTPPKSENGQSRAPIVTFHDVGMNAPLCFSSFFTYCRTTRTCPELDTAAAHYHITAPGHLADSADNASVSYEVDDLAAAVVRVLDRLGLRRVVGFGFGLGATILAQASLLATKGRFGGLIMVSPVFYSASLWERTFIGVDSTIFSAGMGLGRRGKDRFIERWLGPEAKDFNHDLIAHLEGELDRLQSSNVGRFLAAEGRRPDLSEQLQAMRHTKCILITGRESPLRFHVEEGFSKFDPQAVTWLDVMDIGSFVLEEAPERAAKSISLYLQGFGTS